MATYYQRIDVLLNARAGKQNANAASQIAEACRAAGCEANVRVVEGAALAAAAADAVARGSEVVVAAGGDGTVSAVAGALAGSGTALGVMPLGTLNHFAKDIGMPLDPADAARAIAARRTTSIDVGEVNGRLFVNNVSIGMYARLVAERAAMQRLGRGKWIAHGLAAMRVWNRYHPLRVSLDAGDASRHVRTPFVFVGNNTYQLSGFELGGRKALSGGRLHVCMAPGMSRRGVARMIGTAIFGDVCRLDAFDSFTAAAVTLDAGRARIEASIDGEAVVVDNPLRFRSRPAALRVIVP